MEKDTKKYKSNAYLYIKRVKKGDKVYENYYLALKDGTSFQIAMRFYNYKLAYKVKKALEEAQ